MSGETPPSTGSLPPDLHGLATDVKALARDCGFELVGICGAEKSARGDYLRRWLTSGRAGTMSFMAERAEERIDPGVYLPGAKTVVCVAMNYASPLEPAGDQPVGRIARYALGEDYHEVIKPRLYEIADFIRARVPGARTRCGVDTAPIAERELAARAGLGWIGKNTCIINEKIGSWLLLGEVLTTVALPVDSMKDDRCGTCTRCIEACPTGAIDKPYELDASRCISYLTIEHEGAIPETLAGKVGNWIFGCDVCQEVCPWNGRAPVTNAQPLRPRIRSGALSLAEVGTWEKADFDRTFRGTAVKRVRLPVLQRNVDVARRNLGG